MKHILLAIMSAIVGFAIAAMVIGNYYNPRQFDAWTDDAYIYVIFPDGNIHMYDKEVYFNE